MKTENGVTENKFITWLKRLWYEEYALTIYFAGKKIVTDGGTEIYVRTPKKYKVEKVYTLKPNLIKFKDLNGQEIEIRSEEPMNWDLVKKY